MFTIFHLVLLPQQQTKSTPINHLENTYKTPKTDIKQNQKQKPNLKQNPKNKQSQVHLKQNFYQKKASSAIPLGRQVSAAGHI